VGLPRHAPAARETGGIHPVIPEARSRRWGLAILVALAAVAGPAAASAAAPSPVASGDAGLSERADGSGGEVQHLQTSDSPKPRSARRAQQWYEVGEDAGPTYNCVGGYPEPLGRAWGGWFGEIGVTPQVNQTYYVKAGWGVSGFPCTGGARVHVEMVLPAHTQLAINQNNPVRCWYKGPQQTSAHQFTQDCPQQPGTGWNGGPSFDPPGEAAWPTATGALFEIWVPVKSSQPLNGLAPPAPTPCSTCLYVGTWMIDGWNSPWVYPKIPVYVVGSSTPQNPSVGYPAPAVTDVAYDTGLNEVTARLYANIYDEGTTGTARFEAGPKKGEYPFKGEVIAIPPPPGPWQAFEDWFIDAGKAVHWRLCYSPSAGSKVCGADQTISVPPDTAISAVKLKKSKRKATFSFTSPPVPNMNVTFQCKLDGAAFKACTSPKTYSKLRGKHTFSVRAIDQAGHKDSTPAKESFKL
jgi:hypothetical protein